MKLSRIQHHKSYDFRLTDFEKKTKIEKIWKLQELIFVWL